MEGLKISKKKYWLIGLGILVVAIVIFIIARMNGTVTKTSSGDKENEVVTLNCNAENVSYPFFAQNDGVNKTLNITARFTNDKLSSLYLQYFMAYSNADSIKNSEAVNHFNVSRSFEKDGLAPAAYSSTYNQLDNGLQFSIYVSDDEIDSLALKYFMLSGMMDYSEYTMENVEKVYANGGISCTKQ